MEAMSPFAQMPLTPEPIIIQVCRELTADCEAASRPGETDLDRLAEASVRELWDSRVRVFIPILALRRARETLGVHDGRTVPPDATAIGTAPPHRSPRTQDVLKLDSRDVLTLRDDR